MYEHPSSSSSHASRARWWSSAIACLLAAVAGANSALAQTPQIRSTVTTGAFQLVTGHTAKVHLVDSGLSSTPVPVTLQLLNSKGTVVGTANGVVRPGSPLSLSVTAAQVLGRSSAVPVYVRVVAQRREDDTQHALIVSLEFQRNSTVPAVGPATIVAASCSIGSGLPGGTPEGAEPYCGGCFQFNEVVP